MNIGLKFWVAVGMAALVAVPATAAFTPDQPWDASYAWDELNLYEIYNELYGTTYSSNSEMDSLQATETGLFTIADDPDAIAVDIEADVRYAWLTHNVGWYEVNPDLSVTQHPLFSGIDQIGFFPDGTYEATITPESWYGLYNYTHVPGDPARGYSWFSEPGRNLNGEDHFLVYSTPDPTTILVAWEDLPWVNPYPGPEEDPFELFSDRDYNDLVMLVTVRDSVVPEPCSILLFGMGVAGMMVRRFVKPS